MTHPSLHRSQRGRKGQLLVELLVALSVLTVGFLGIISLLARSLSLNRVITDNYRATYLAAEGIEVVKNILDANYVNDPTGTVIPWNFGLTGGWYEVEYDATIVGPAPIEVLSASPSWELYRSLRFDPDTNLYTYRGLEGVAFRRAIRTELLGSNEVKVNAVVHWATRGGGTFEVNVEDHFYDWRP